MSTGLAIIHTKVTIVWRLLCVGTFFACLLFYVIYWFWIFMEWGDTVLEAVDIVKQYRGKRALDGVGFTLSPGEFLGVAGHNGSGKSTLMSIVAQVQRPTAGDLRSDGHSIVGNRAFLRRSMGYAPQKNGLLPDLTVLQTLRFWQRTYGLAGGLFAPGTPAAVMGLEPLQKKRVGTLSGGMQKRLSVALALMNNPRYLLLDEVLGAMDRHYRTALHDWLAGFRAQGGAVLYCSHEVEELRAVCDSILVLRDGRTVYYGPAAAFPTQAAVLDEIMNPLGQR